MKQQIESLMISVQTAAVGSFGEIVGFVTKTVRSLIPLVMTLALLYFLYGAAQYILESKDEGKREEGRQVMLYGVLALFVMVSIAGIVQVLSNSLQLNNAQLPLPRL